MDSNKRIFISHSHKDAFYASKVIDILEKIGVGSDRIFCSSVAGYGVPLGEDSLNEIKKWLNEDVVVIFLLSQAYYGSPVSLCEMGACWITGRKVFPILIPPMTFEEVGGVFNRHMGFYINDGIHWSQLKEQIEDLFSISVKIQGARWEQFRSGLLQSLEEKIPVDKSSKIEDKVSEIDDHRVSMLKKSAFTIGYSCLQILLKKQDWRSVFLANCRNFNIDISWEDTDGNKMAESMTKVERILGQYDPEIVKYWDLPNEVVYLMIGLQQGCKKDTKAYLNILESIPELVDKRDAFERLWDHIPYGSRGVSELLLWLDEIKGIIDNA